MHPFYKKSLVILFVLVVVNALFALVFLKRIYVSHILLPIEESVIPWSFSTITDVEKGGSSSVVVNDSIASLSYDYVLTGDVQYPHVTALLAFDKLENAQRLIDLSGYSTLRFRVKCEPSNVLVFYLHSLDPLITDQQNFSSYRISESLFSCDKAWSEIEIDLHHMNVATWWLQNFGAVISDQQYRLDQVLAFSFGASRLGPIDTPANVEIVDLALSKRDWRYAWLLIGVSLLGWLAYAVWLVKRYTQSLVTSVKEKLQSDRQLIAYQQLSIEPHKDKEKSQILRFLAAEYANPELNLDMAISVLGINRTKINEILKEELGITFNACINKLRLAEAARLLAAKKNVNVTDVAFTVGYNDASYFNKLFKSEYGCTPKAFKNIYHSEEAD